VLQKFCKILTLSILASIAVACSDGSGLPPGGNSSVYRIDPQFREFYNELGGRDVLGEAISPVFFENGLKCQYTNNVLLIYDSQESDHMRLRLGPLGLRLGVSEPPVEAPSQPDKRYIEGHNIFDEFMPLFEKLGGVRYVGRPLTEVHYNPDEKSNEQYFENLGFSHPEGAAAGKVALLPYGDMVCGDECAPADSKLVERNTKEPPATVAPQFKDFVASFGRDFTGFALTEPVLGPDGRVEQVFENLVLVESTDEPSGFTLRPLPEKVGILPEAMVDDNDISDMPFLPIADGKGFHLPVYFGDYIFNHGSFNVTGLPINEPEQLTDQVARQCFKNLCLKYDPNELNGSQVRPEPLGYNYRDKYIGGSPKTLPAQNSLPDIIVDISPAVASTQEQKIEVTVLEKGAPLSGVIPSLELTLQDGSMQSYTFPPTNKNGWTSLTLPDIKAVNPGMIPYRVCVPNSQGGQACEQGSFVLWNNP
jgi:hypothetical protein